MKRSAQQAIASVLVVSAIVIALAPRLGATDATQPATAHATLDTAVFAGGCFWGVEAVFDHVKGVQTAESGYAAGVMPTPSYDHVGAGGVGHAESVRVIFDPSQVSYAQLVQIFFATHDPTELNRQGPDVGSEYRSAIFYRTMQQRHIADAYVRQLAEAKSFARPIVTQITRLNDFYLAEGIHQDYLAHHLTQPYIVTYDAPKLVTLKERFPEMYRS